MRIRAAVANLSPEIVGQAFVASLTSRIPALRSPLATYAIGKVLPEHDLSPEEGTYAVICRLCGWSQMPTEAEEMPVSHLAGWRDRFGGVAHDKPEYMEFDLTTFDPSTARVPLEADWRCLDLILRTPALLSPEAKPADLQAALKTAIRSNKNERTVLIQILSLVGVLQPRAHPTFYDGYVPPEARQLPPVRFADWGYPTIWWRAWDGVREEAVSYWFPEYRGFAG